MAAPHTVPDAHHRSFPGLQQQKPTEARLCCCWAGGGTAVVDRNKSNHAPLRLKPVLALMPPCSRLHMVFLTGGANAPAANRILWVLPEVALPVM